jgi:chromosome partitioning protein
MIITIGSTKGGVGKSTIACNLAVAAAADAKTVLLVDADLQGSSMGFCAARQADDIQAAQITSATLHDQLDAYAHELIIIDAGGRDNVAFRSAIMASDLVAIPCLPSSVDFWAVDDVLKILRDARRYKSIDVCIILNQIVPNTRLAGEILQALKEYEDFARIVTAPIGSRVVYKNSFALGKGVTEMHDWKAAREIQSLYDAIIGGYFHAGR